MSPTSDNDRSNPIKRAFSKFLERGDVSKPKDPERASPTVSKGQTRTAPRAQAARAGTPTSRVAATATPASRSTAPGSTASGTAGGTPRTGAETPVTAGSRITGAATPGTIATSSASASAQSRTYTVQKGDSLSKIAQQVYGRADKWHAIFDANRDRIDDPDLIHPGQVLVLPDAPKLH